MHFRTGSAYDAGAARGHAAGLSRFRTAIVVLQLGAAAVFAGTGCGRPMDQKLERDASRAGLPAAIKALDGTRIFFAHQSVGENIVDGLRSLQQETHAATLNIVDPAGVPATHGFFAHARLGRNGDAKGKTDAFVSTLESGLGEHLDVALQKYCYADMDAGTNPSELFDHYRQGMDRLRKRFPHLTIVHVTTPLMAVQSGPKAAIKKLIGRAPDHYLENGVREQYNELLRREYQGREPIFDLAVLESSRPGRARDELRFGGATYYALRPEYTTDGGHLTRDAQERVASELLRFLARVVNQSASAPPPSFE